MNTSGADASMAAGGVQINYVPRDGGNSYKGLFFFSGANSAMQGTNYSTGTRDATGACTPADSLFCRGLVTQPGALVKVYDVNPGFGGPIIKDKLWFFGTARWTAAVNYVPNNYHNPNFVVGQTSPSLLNTTTASLRARHQARLADHFGGSGRFWEQTVRLSYQMGARRTSSASTTTTRSGDTPTASTTRHRRRARAPTSSRSPISWFSGRRRRPTASCSRPGFWRHQETWGNKRAPNDIIDPLAVGITDNNPQTPYRATSS